MRSSKEVISPLGPGVGAGCTGCQMQKEDAATLRLSVILGAMKEFIVLPGEEVSPCMAAGKLCVMSPGQRGEGSRLVPSSTGPQFPHRESFTGPQFPHCLNSRGIY